jgi:tetratricopeptide (TPR) repeat protein
MKNVLLLTFLAGLAMAAPDAPESQNNLGRALRLAESGQCNEALPLLRRGLARPIADHATRRAVEVAGLRCGMTVGRPPETLPFIQALSRDYPEDPEVLYMLVHAYSDLSIAASRELLYKAPESVQVHQLNAEALETQGKWDEAAAEYKRVLEKHPNLEGMHYRLGRLLLSRPDAASATEEARKEFEAELRINPVNAGAEFVLGELARRAGDYDAAISHFSNAAKYDRGFAAAHLGLGKALLGASRSAEAIAPLEAAIRLDPNDPEGHFQLSMAYRREGKNDAANREAARHKELSDRARVASEDIQKKVLGIPDARRPE